MIVIIVVILVPLYYLAKSKGYNAVHICVVSGIAGWLTPYAALLFWDVPPLPLLFYLTVPLCALIVVWLLPAKKGAPGKAYLNITFECPECHQQIMFHREKEGAAELCPKCGEVVTVPTDQFTPVQSSRIKTRPQTSEGDVCFETFARQEDASLLHILLESHGVASRIVGDNSIGLLAAAWQDYKVVIHAKDWDQAIEIQKSQQNPLCNGADRAVT